MGVLILIVFYGSILFCIIASAMRAGRYASAPIHLHWELYREGSVYELTDWWTRPHAGFGRKLKSAATDLFFLKGYYERDRRLWFFLYLFHIGIYLLILWHAWLFLGAVIVDPEKASAFGRISGHLATALAFVGGSGILIMRIADRDLRSDYPSIHYIKWILILVTLVGGFYAVDVYFDGRMPELLKYVRDQVTFQNFEKKLHPSAATASHVFLASLWLIYFPFSHIMKLFFRYYHQLRWDDIPNRKGSAIESKIKGLLDLPVTWSGPHIPSGKKWSEAASGTGLEGTSSKP